MKTIVIPAFNAEKTLPKCLNALKPQLIPPQAFEVIVVDDGSTDNTAQLAEEAGVTVIRGRNRGPADNDDNVSWQTELAARPRAVLHAGKYLFIGGMKAANIDTAVDDWTAGNICVLSGDDGGIVNNVELKAPPVWDGMAAADGRLYVSTENGTVVCLAAAETNTPQ